MSNAREGRANVLVAVATYNEIENLPLLIDELLRLPIELDVLVVDDDSPDGSGRWAMEESVKCERVHAIVRQNERGLGTAVLRALRYAVDNDYDFVVNMDADFSHPTSVVPKLVARISDEEQPQVDVVVGSRYVPGGQTPDWSFKRRAASRCVNFFARLTLGLTTRDCSGAFRCYRVATLKKLDFNAIVSRGYSFFEEILFRLMNVGATFAETPIVFKDRTRGASKINLSEAIKAIWIMSMLWVNRAISKPNNDAEG